MPERQESAQDDTSLFRSVPYGTDLGKQNISAQHQSKMIPLSFSLTFFQDTSCICAPVLQWTPLGQQCLTCCVFSNSTLCQEHGEDFWDLGLHIAVSMSFLFFPSQKLTEELLDI